MSRFRFILNLGRRYSTIALFGCFTGYQLIHMDIAKPYAWGWNNFGQLGLGHAANQQVPQPITALDGNTVLFVAASASASAAVTSQGELYTWGKSRKGILGHPNSSENNLNIPTLVQCGELIKSVSCGNNHMAAITTKGEVLTWGNPEHGKLGHSYESPDKTVRKNHYNTGSTFNSGQVPQKVALPKRVKSIVCANQHTACVTIDGEVYIWGQNKKGSLGLKSEETEILKPTRLNILEKIVKIDAGADFTIALTEDGKLYAWGSNYFGQLGNPNALHLDTPTPIAGFAQKVTDFSCGEQFVGAVDSDGRLYTWGNQQEFIIQVGYGGDGQLGHQNKQDIPVPRIVEFDQPVKSISCGMGHVAILTTKGHLYMFGRGKEGQLGRGSEIESPNSYRIKPQPVLLGKTVSQVACGGSHTLALIV